MSKEFDCIKSSIWKHIYLRIDDKGKTRFMNQDSITYTRTFAVNLFGEVSDTLFPCKFVMALKLCNLFVGDVTDEFGFISATHYPTFEALVDDHVVV